MSLFNTEQRYGRLSLALHWLMLVLLVVIYVCMEFRGYFPKGSATREGMKAWHFMLGLSVPLLVAVRLAVRAAGERVLIIPAPPLWQQRLASAVHGALYVFMIVMPVLGWLTLSAAGKPIPFFGLELPALVTADKALARQVLEIHETLALVGYGLVGMHALAGLYHHYVVRDNTLQRILP